MKLRKQLATGLAAVALVAPLVLGGFNSQVNANAARTSVTRRVHKHTRRGLKLTRRNKRNQRIRRTRRHGKKHVRKHAKRTRRDKRARRSFKGRRNRKAINYKVSKQINAKPVHAYLVSGQRVFSVYLNGNKLDTQKKPTYYMSTKRFNGLYKKYNKRAIKWYAKYKRTGKKRYYIWAANDLRNKRISPIVSLQQPTQKGAANQQQASQK